MSGGSASGVDEFESIARLLRPLAKDAPEALDLMDDAAVVPSRPGFDLILAKDAMIEGVHFLPDDPLDLVARKLIRVNLSDLAAKGADPYGYLLFTAWPARCGWTERELFAKGLGEDQAHYGLKLLGGDTSSTPGPLALSLTILGWTPEGRMVKRSGARPGDRLLVSGTIGDGFLGLKAAQGELDAPALADRYRLPRPRVELAAALRAHASAAADVSDGLIADAGHIAEASRTGVRIDLARMPLSASAKAWLAGESDQAMALAALASGGDDYEVVCACAPEAVRPLVADADRAGLSLTELGEFEVGEGVQVFVGDRKIEVERAGWRHG